LVTAVNLVLLGAAVADRGWFALAIAAYLGPFVNGVMLVVLLWNTTAIRRHTGMSILQHLAFSLAVPSVAAGVDALIILSMDMRGGC